MEAPFTPYTAAVGLRSVEKRIGRGEIASVYLAADADARLSHKVLSLCVEHHVPCMRCYTRQQMGEFARLDVPAAVVGILI